MREASAACCWPDAAVRIRLGGRQNHGSLAYIEYDRSTETSRQIAAKSEPYQLLVDERRYERHWQSPLSNPLVRVLFIARSEERIRHLTEALRETRAANLFRFATYAELVPETLLTSPSGGQSADNYCRYSAKTRRLKDSRMSSNDLQSISTSEPLLVTAVELAQLLHVSTRTLWRLRSGATARSRSVLAERFVGGWKK